MLAEKHGEKEKQKKKDYVRGVHKGPLSKERKKSTEDRKSDLIGIVEVR